MWSRGVARQSKESKFSSDPHKFNPQLPECPSLFSNSFAPTVSAVVATWKESLTSSIDPTGTKFDTISDVVDDINVAKLKAQKKDNAYDESQFDSEKDKATFRQFVDSNESSRRFYM